MAEVPVGMCAAADAPRRSTLAIAAKALENIARRTPPSHTCQQRLKLSFYFDGTGNNRDADTPTYEHSNVARMFFARKDDSAAEGIYSFYVPGLGTYFMDINDRGETYGKGFGSRGEDRLQWALKKLQERRAMAHKLCGIDIAVFGFSRGAALARAFANRVQALCEADGGSWVLKGTKVAVDVYFMGLWDTVASTGLPKSVNNQSKLGLIGDQVHDWWYGDGGYEPAVRMQERDVRTIAYGQPGADPAPAHLYSWADGHAAWGSEMEIPPIVSGGAHMMAGHEIRNSFPVDSTLKGNTRPAAFEGQEFVYPGVHSNVGGGYRPGEGGRSVRKGQQLSLITLRVMYDKARAAGVPLNDLNDEKKVISDLRLDFARAIASDPEENHAAAAEYDQMLTLWNAYMDYCGRAARPMGQWFLAHMKAYYAWRFWNIKANHSVRQSGEATQDEKRVKPLEEQSKREDAELGKKIEAAEASPEVRQARSNTANARRKLQQAQQREHSERTNPSGWMAPMSAEEAKAFVAARNLKVEEARVETAAAQRELEAAQQTQTQAEDGLRRLEARKATLPSQGTLGRNLRQYDERLYADGLLLSKNKLGQRHLRPHYKALLQAWEDEFLNNKGLIDARVMKFFEAYVHDSLADFNHDATLPSDPRVVYVGGDERALFAMNAAPVGQANVKAA
jgi:Uncharacterized alpha/beta hydrolase domain (DUF2235)